jgi:hypothetical protein
MSRPAPVAALIGTTGATPPVTARRRDRRVRVVEQVRLGHQDGGRDARVGGHREEALQAVQDMILGRGVRDEDVVHVGEEHLPGAREHAAAGQDLGDRPAGVEPDPVAGDRVGPGQAQPARERGEAVVVEQDVPAVAGEDAMSAQRSISRNQGIDRGRSDSPRCARGEPGSDPVGEGDGGAALDQVPGIPDLELGGGLWMNRSIGGCFGPPTRSGP